jgi:hypothetical protein
VLVGRDGEHSDWQAGGERMDEDKGDARPDSLLAKPDANIARRVTLEDLRRFADTYSDLADPTIMTSAWRT